MGGTMRSNHRNSSATTQEHSRESVGFGGVLVELEREESEEAPV
eukprot:CAMPEP_0117452568 /NCGR_PEP_ID=MMETSP0759-20121206/9696_1 /TAXON_ID=63605 /ORGANISM="Percolomonas cosmopolitus, Strain WS" /LENGTH=43 /DNA_ID= /DNA_START= /DNA_END= /DNA_ORIENTATION=